MEYKLTEKEEEEIDLEFTHIDYMAGRVLNRTTWQSTKGLNKLKSHLAQAIGKRVEEIKRTALQVQKQGVSDADWDSETSKEDVYAQAISDFIKTLNT